AYPARYPRSRSPLAQAPSPKTPVLGRAGCLWHPSSCLHQNRSFGVVGNGTQRPPAAAAARGRPQWPRRPSAAGGPPGTQTALGLVLAEEALVEPQIQQDPVRFADLAPGRDPEDLLDPI